MTGSRKPTTHLPAIEGVMLGQASCHFAAARSEFIAGLLALDTIGLEPTEEFADIVDGVMFVDAEITGLAEAYGRAATRRARRRAAR